MRKQEFRAWLLQRIKAKPASDCLSRCSAVEEALGIDLDREFAKDEGKSVVSTISYSKKDADNRLPIPAGFTFKEGSNPVQRMTDLRSAVRKYFTFCKEGDSNSSVQRN